MQRNAVPNVVNMLLSAAEGLLTIANDRGNIPLHLLFRQESAILQQPNIEYIKLVLKFIDKKTQSLIHQNIDGDTPLHLMM